LNTNLLHLLVESKTEILREPKILYNEG